MKQGEENTQFIKDESDDTKKYIFQSNKKTTYGAYFILAVLIVIVVAIAFSWSEFQS
ncbi:hypothetical protein JQC67_00390 [Aurantibacter crassamenti]|uniref:hypothetical protein n=1 Tax=Aurantibacter crassamenti TaxID=1837375 RepID=UPI0019393483|nr:hypothetical protein [Aurantibacter crassamenti]MBM1104582.1 hypothetical protein [Aurantibacter crassamenti]